MIRSKWRLPDEKRFSWSEQLLLGSLYYLYPRFSSPAFIAITVTTTSLWYWSLIWTGTSPNCNMFICCYTGSYAAITLDIRMQFISSCQLYFILCPTSSHGSESFFKRLFIFNVKVYNITDVMVVLELFRSTAQENLTQRKTISFEGFVWCDSSILCAFCIMLQQVYRGPLWIWPSFLKAL